MKSHNKDGVGDLSFEEMVFTKNRTVNRASVFINRSTYIIHIEQWIKTFSRQQVLIIDGDEFREDQLSPLKNTESFLGIEHFITRDKFAFNEEKGFYCLKTKTTIFGESMHCLGEGKGRAHPEISPEAKRKLENYFTPFNKRLFQLMGRTLDW